MLKAGSVKYFVLTSGTALRTIRDFINPNAASDRVPVCRIVFLGRGGSEIDSVKQRFLFGG
jgi:hypothetical protein